MEGYKKVINGRGSGKGLQKKRSHKKSLGKKNTEILNREKGLCRLCSGDMDLGFEQGWS